jgi:hypothetical protein
MIICYCPAMWARRDSIVEIIALNKCYNGEDLASEKLSCECCCIYA